ncbi:AbrB/MazE/SpoVT family DNA-binding domain-containing protein [Candidatus Shapirobacteria bacterium]|nr:AbrB/MazE/SpoVT family DNA-binding domain-containing protein [Candidatus Shapirobacteria bacterium]
MQQLATITSKRQLTIPVSIFRKLGLLEGEQVLVKTDNGRMVISLARELVEDLAGSVAAPKRFRGLPTEKIIKLAKKVYFRKKR